MSLELESISHQYGAFDAVAGASLTVESGEIVCLVGHSGCGKTTLLRIAAGLERLQTGQVSLGGAVVARPGAETPPEKRAIGFVFQDFVLFPHLTVERNVAFGLYGAADARSAVHEQLEALRLTGLERRYPHELSGGQQQRVALARALVRRPRALLLDEPFASIDTVLRRALRDELRAVLRRQDAAVLLVTHDPQEALALGDRIAFMRAGRIVETAAPNVLFAAPKTIEGALLFPGRQRLAGDIRGGAFISDVFDPVPAPGLGDGPAAAAALPGAFAAAPDPGGAFIVRDAHFVGPHWRALVGREYGPAIAVSLDWRPVSGERLKIALDVAKILVFSAP